MDRVLLFSWIKAFNPYSPFSKQGLKFMVLTSDLDWWCHQHAIAVGWCGQNLYHWTKYIFFILFTIYTPTPRQKCILFLHSLHTALLNWDMCCIFTPTYWIYCALHYSWNCCTAYVAISMQQHLHQCKIAISRLWYIVSIFFFFLSTALISSCFSLLGISNSKDHRPTVDCVQLTKPNIVHISPWLDKHGTHPIHPPAT